MGNFRGLGNRGTSGTFLVLFLCSFAGPCRTGTGTSGTCVYRHVPLFPVRTSRFWALQEGMKYRLCYRLTFDCTTRRRANHRFETRRRSSCLLPCRHPSMSIPPWSSLRRSARAAPQSGSKCSFDCPPSRNGIARLCRVGDAKASCRRCPKVGAVLRSNAAAYPANSQPPATESQ